MLDIGNAAAPADTGGPVQRFIVDENLPAVRLDQTGKKIGQTALAYTRGLSLAFGFSQVLRNSPGTELYNETPLPGILVGFFANRNSTAIFLVCCLTLLCGRPASRMLSPAWLAKLIGGVLMATGVLLTQSRTGVVLLGIPLTLVLCRLGAGMLARNGAAARQWSRRRRFMLGGTAAAALLFLVVAVGTSVMQGNSRLGDLASRFAQSEDARSEIWEDARFSAHRYWPVGAGMGTFDEVFQLDESLETSASGALAGRITTISRLPSKAALRRLRSCWGGCCGLQPQRGVAR